MKGRRPGRVEVVERRKFIMYGRRSYWDNHSREGKGERGFAGSLIGKGKNFP